MENCVERKALVGHDLYFMLVCCIGLLLVSVKGYGQNNQIVLVQGGHSDYTIFVSRKEDEDLQVACKDLQQSIREMSGASLPVTSQIGSGKQIILGLFSDLSSKYNLANQNLNPEGFIIKSIGANIIIAAETVKGIENGTYTFLNKLGCYYFSQEEGPYIPKKTTIELNPLLIISNPAFQSRFLFSYEGLSKEYCRWNRLNIVPRDNPKWLQPWIHTTTQYVSSKEYFKQHPEYFMLMNGKREPKEIDFTNKEVLDIIVNKIKVGLRKHPQAKYIGVSQADGIRNLDFQDPKCRLIVSQNEGRKSAVILTLANKVAQSFPDKIITTLAYNYSRTPPPANFHIEPNILIIYANRSYERLRTVYLHNIEQKGFYRELSAWKKLDPNIMVWLYSANFSYPVSPYPNLYMLQNKLSTCRELGIKKVFEQCNGARGAEFQKLRSFLLAQLMWDPNQSTDSLVHLFLDRYYQNAAPHIYDYIQSLRVSFRNNGHLTVRNANNGKFINYLTPQSITKSKQCFEQARNAVSGNTLLLKRLDEAEQPLRFSELMLLKEDRKKGNKLKLFRQNAQSMPQKEQQLLDTFIQKAQLYGTHKITPHAATPGRLKKVWNQN